MGANCRDCADHQQAIPAVTMVGKTPVCLEHWRSRMGIPKKTGAPSAANVVPPTPSREVGELMAIDKICGCGCGEKMRKDSTREYKMGHEPAGGAKRKQASSNGSASGHDVFNRAIAELASRRERIDSLITNLEWARDLKG